MSGKLTLAGALTAGIGSIVAAIILSATAKDPPGPIVIQGKTVEPRLYHSATIGDGLTPETAFRPAIDNDVAGKIHKYKWDPSTGEVIVWVDASDHAALAQKHEFLGAPEAGP